MSPFKYLGMMIVYFWLRFDPVLYLTFKGNWTPRYEFLASIFGEADADKFLQRRIKLVKSRSQKPPQIVHLSSVDKQAGRFLKYSPARASGRQQRHQIIETLIFWTLDPAINQYNVESYKTRQAIVDCLLNLVFQNAIASEVDQILAGLKKIVFSRITYLGAKGEPSPIVHEAIISGVGRILGSHLSEIIRLRDEKLDKMTKIRLIKEIQKAKGETGSLAFSAEAKKHDQFRTKYPLPESQAKLLMEILNHYRFSAWPDSRQKAIGLIGSLEKNLGFELNELFAKK